MSRGLAPAVLAGALCAACPPPFAAPDAGVVANATFERVAGALAPDDSPALTNSSGGFVVGDFDGSGTPDILVANGYSWHLTWASEGTAPHRPTLFTNKGGRRLLDVPLPDGVPAGWYPTVAAADLDGDGTIDLLLPDGDPKDEVHPPDAPPSYDYVAWRRGDAFEPSRFVETSPPGTTFGTCVADFDRDGDVDVFVANQRDVDLWENDEDGFFVGERDRLFRNAGGGVFEDVTDAAGDLTAPRLWSNACLAWDFDDDGLEDIWVATDKAPLKVYRNTGDMTFVDVSAAVIGELAHKVGNWMGFAIGDYDGDGDQDVFVTNWGISAYTTVSPTSLGHPDHYVLNALLRNEGDGTFVDVAQITDVKSDRKGFHERWEPPPEATGLAAWEFGWAASFEDYDNDGDVDLYWNGNLAISRYTAVIGKEVAGANPGRLMQNEGDGTFTEVGAAAGVQNLDEEGFILNGWGSALVDLDADGWLDLIVGNQAIDDPDYPGDLRVFWNRGGDHHWLEIALAATASAPHAIGAKVAVTAGGRTRHRVVATTSGVSTNGALTPLHFGLGAADVVERVAIEWPSGARQELLDVAADQVLRVVEPAIAPTIAPTAAR